MAGRAHEGEFRRIRGEPFITHPVGVARIASEYEPTDFIQAVSLLHDVRDQPLARERITLPELRQSFGFDISFAVVSLSKVLQPTWTDDEIKQQYIEMARQETEPEIQLIRAADKIHNLESAIEEVHLVQDAFWRYFKGGRDAYLRWPADVLRAIEESGALSGHEILARYEMTIQRFYQAAEDQAS